MAKQISDVPRVAPAPATPANPFTTRRNVFVWLALFLVVLAILRSAISTSMDGFTIDEAYHIAAGVSYVKYHDFRINPEHPPLVKLWVGIVMHATGFRLDSLRRFNDKPGERDFANLAVFRQNDPDSVQRRARVAMYGLNGLLLLALAFALERVFNAGVSLGTLLFLAIDPTVAAHLPVVMTDLPVALLSATAVVLGARAFREWRWPYLALCSAFLGLALTAKHSAPVTVLGVALIGAVLAIAQRLESPTQARWLKGVKLCAVLGGAMVVLWASYLFRYSESPSGLESFNRPLVEKINDVASPRYHAVLTVMAATYAVPRAYLWGFADTIHAGMEGREDPQLFFGRLYNYRGPRYFFPAMIAIKVPIGLLAVLILGLFLFLTGRIPTHWILPCGVVLAVAGLFLLVLSMGATYAGIRHALPVVVLLSVLAGVAFEMALTSRSRQLKILVTLAFVAALVSALPQMRPWEYFNEFVGGSANAYKYFRDEGVDLGQRSKEFAAYYKREVKLNGPRPVCLYWIWDEEKVARGIDCLGSDEKRDSALIELPERSGTIFAGPSDFIHSSYWDTAALRETKPVKRFGNLFIFSGTFYLPGQAASELYWRGFRKIYGSKPADEEAERAFHRSVELDPTAYFVHIQLGNLYLKSRSREKCVRAYSEALKYAPEDPKIRSALQNQIRRVSREELSEVNPLRDPHME
jgi:tetratricopeptide (TPR) repeat protein